MYVSGKLFGLVVSKMAIASIVGKFEVSPCAGTPQRMHLNPRALVLASKGEIPLNFTRLSD
jgi:hypothetical protein